MKKTFVLFGIAVAVVGLVAVSVLAGAALVNAQAPTPETQTPWGGRGYMMGGDQPMAEFMHAALAEKLGISEADLESQIAAGKTLWQIAEEKGLTAEETTTLMQDARDASLAKMVADGTITQEQSDWMSERGNGMMGGRGANGASDCPMWDGDESGTSNSFFGGRGTMGGGRGMMSRGR